MMSAGEKFRAALKEERPLQIAGAVNAYAAMMAGSTGFRALYLSGAGVSQRLAWAAGPRRHHAE